MYLYPCLRIRNPEFSVSFIIPTHFAANRNHDEQEAGRRRCHESRRTAVSREERRGEHGNGVGR